VSSNNHGTIDGIDVFVTPGPGPAPSSDANVVVGDSHAIVFGNGAAGRSTIEIGTHGNTDDASLPTALVSSTVTTNSGDPITRVDLNPGRNTIQFDSNYTLIVWKNGQVLQLGTATRAEAVQALGTNNVIINYGLIENDNANQNAVGAAIWFQDLTTSPTLRNTIDNYGTIRVSAGRSVIGSSSPDVNSGSVTFINHTNARVEGNISFASGNDILQFFPNSVVTGNINGGGGINDLELNGIAGSFDALPGALTNFTTLTKLGDGRWDVTGSLVGFTTVTVKQGTLGLTGNNTDYEGVVVVDPGAVIESRAESLPTSSDNLENIINNGTVRFNRTTDTIAPYTGQIVGSGIVEIVGAGTTTLEPLAADGNTYSGGTYIYEGGLAISRDAALGAPTGPLTIDGSTAFLRLNGNLDLSPDRVITIGAGNGAIDTQGFTSTISQGMTGPGHFTKRGSGRLILAGENTYRGGTAISAGILQLGRGDGGGPTGSILGDVDIATGAELAFNRSNEYAFAGLISGAGNVRQIGTGTTILTGASTYAGATSVEAGTLAAGADNVFSPQSAFTILADGTLALRGFDQTVASVINAGTIQFHEPVGTVLTTRGDYTGAGGLLMIDTALGDDTSPTDRMLVEGDSMGSSRIAVRNVGGQGAQTVEGIKIVDVMGTSDGVFTLVGDYTFQGAPAVIGGAYAYQLHQNGISTPTDGDWYLRSTFTPTPPSPTPPGPTPPGPTPPGPTPPGPMPPGPTPSGPIPPGPPPRPIYQPGVPLYEALPRALLALNDLPTLQQRVGNRFWSTSDGGPATDDDAATRIRLLSGYGDDVAIGAVGAATSPALEHRRMWGRIEGWHSRAKPDVSTSGTDTRFNVLRLQAGVDRSVYDNTAGSLIAGLTAHYGTFDGDVSSLFGRGDIDIQAYGVGGTLTWYGANGAYLDGQMQLTWFDTDLKSKTLRRTMADGNGGFGYALGVEAGKRLPLNEAWTLTPQAQLVYSQVDFDRFTDPFGAQVSLDRGDSLRSRFGLSADYERARLDAASEVVRTHLYGIANLYYEFRDETRVEVSGTDIINEEDSLWGGAGIGGSHSWAGGRYAVYGEVIARTSLAHFADSYILNGTAGLRVRW